MIAGMTASLGTAVLQGIHCYMDTKIAYFKYLYSWQTAVLLFGLPAVICVAVPVLIYGHMEKESLTQRISLF